MKKYKQWLKELKSESEGLSIASSKTETELKILFMRVTGLKPKGFPNI